MRNPIATTLTHSQPYSSPEEFPAALDVALRSLREFASWSSLLPGKPRCTIVRGRGITAIHASVVCSLPDLPDDDMLMETAVMLLDEPAVVTHATGEPPC